ncbi:putative inorganic polyphosphate/ATP-NAD kinase [bacterium BMS3Bbin02]|nr:putative inorganic polyphosphate/ATP-NAD kinase [bacterium BMS3Bbin02]
MSEASGGFSNREDRDRLSAVRPERVAFVTYADGDTARALAETLAGEAASRFGFEGVYVPAEAQLDDVDAVVSVGGDGTVLHAAAAAREADVPILGINLGRVGYLAEVEMDAVDHVLKRLGAGDLDTVEHPTIAVEFEDGTATTAINDIVVEKVVSQRIVDLEVRIDGELLTTYRADGIIVATPLGSTAYSLSAGGPIVQPTVGCMVMTPIAPHSLLSRSFVLRSESIIGIRAVSARPAQVNVDGRGARQLERGETVRVTTSDRPVRFLLTGATPFPRAVRDQFGLDHA